MKIGIIYLTTEAYNKFWKDFYCICEQYFCVDAEKEYKLFTDSPESIGCASSANVYVRQIEDLGWIVNTSYKSEYICSIHEELGKYDYVFYINRHFQFNAPIYAEEVLNDNFNSFLMALYFDHYLQVDIRNIPTTASPIV